MKTLGEDLETALNYHGHLCSGQVLGVRMARFALEKMGLADRKREKMKDLLVYVESDRCATDAAYAVTGATLGRRRMKFADYGKMAMSFYYIPDKRAIRVRCISDVYAPEGADLQEFWSRYGDDELFEAREVAINVSEFDLPGKPKRKAKCAKCGEIVLDGREVVSDGAALCRACASGPYYKEI